MRKVSFYILSITFISLAIFSCKTEESVNPYEGIQTVANDNPDADELPVGNFAWLQAKVFKPTCANSGCHDGTFEPKFNTVASSYASLVNHPVITNDEEGSFVYRVVPNNSSSSLLVERLTNFIPNTSGIMPLELDNDSDWPTESDNYIQKIQEWINNGAQDMYGNSAPGTNADFPPQVDGLAIFPTGNTSDPYERNPDEIGISPILVEAAPIDIWIRVTDDNTSEDLMNSCSVKLSQNVSEFDAQTEFLYNVESGISALDFADSPANFIHKATVDLSSASSGDTFFIRNYLDDFEQTDITELPNDGSNAVISALFILKVQ